ncbi:MAG: hypothetical protein COW30_18565, partial [Rhodospirillales bacterium CG15_BIG_FIL_POST_REV_8_21_14_020_66_15]
MFLNPDDTMSQSLEGMVIRDAKYKYVKAGESGGIIKAEGQWTQEAQNWIASQEYTNEALKQQLYPLARMFGVDEAKWQEISASMSFDELYKKLNVQVQRLHTFAYEFKKNELKPDALRRLLKEDTKINAFILQRMGLKSDKVDNLS